MIHFRRIPLPRFYSVAIIVLKFMVIVVIASPKVSSAMEE